MQTQQPPAVGFNYATRQNRLALPTMAYTANATTQVVLPQVGLLAMIGGYIDISITTGGAGAPVNSTTRTKVGGVTPYSAVARIQLINNQSNFVYDTSLWGNYLWTRTLRNTFDYRNPLTAFGTEAVTVFALPTPGVGATFTYRVPFLIPIALNESLQTGLLLAQNDTTRYTLQITWGDIAANIITLAGGSITAASATCYPYVRYYNVPNNPLNFPDMSRIHQIVEDTTDITGTGDFIYRPQTGPIYLTALQEFVNNGAGMAATVLTNVQEVFSASQTPQNLTSCQWLLDQQVQMAGMAMPQGVYAHNWKFASGILEQAAARDNIDTSAITDFQLKSTIAAGTVLTSAYCRTIREMLFPAV